MTDKINPQNCKSCLREGCYFHPSKKEWREGMTDGMDISPIKISTFTERYGCEMCITNDMKMNKPETIYCQWVDSVIKISELPETCEYFFKNNRCERCPISSQLLVGTSTKRKLLSSINGGYK